MAQMKMPSEPKMYATQYRTLLGVDFQKDVTDVDKNHSPNMVNMISDLGGNPIKRPGYRVFEEDKTVSTYPNDRFIYSYPSWISYTESKSTAEEASLKLL